tara:strand:+ start:7642 stop:8106 length:465 start_codon:yes stop_codon:yes gene_type:complete
MKRFATFTLALTIPAAGAATAEQHLGDQRTYSGIVSSETSQNTLRAEGMIGGEIYSLAEGYEEIEWSGTEFYSKIDPGWEEIGEVEGIVVSRNGEISGLVAEVGGWLDIGDKAVFIDMKDIRIVGDNLGDVAFVTRLSQDQLESRQEIDQAWGW